MNKELLTVLDELNRHFEQPIYVVGGAIRNLLLGYPINDIDLTASISPELVRKRLAFSNFQVKEISQKLFTLLISYKGYCFEFTSFRADNYQKGFHRPVATHLINDIAIDALRRDFSINAIYYEIGKRQLVDPLSGIKDLENKTIKATTSPQKVFSQDGLRLMRLARISAELGFDIEEKTLEEATKFKDLILDISPERIREELNKILVADTKYGQANAHLRGIKLLDKLGVLELILPELTAGKGVQQRKDFHKYDVYDHSLKAFEVARSDIRLVSLLHDIGKPKSIHSDGSMTGHDKVGADMTREIMSRLRYPKREINETVQLIEQHMYDLRGQAKQKSIRKFIQRNINSIDKLIALKQADYIASGREQEKRNSGQRLAEELLKMKEEGIPFSISGLKINGRDLIDLGVAMKDRSVLLNKLLENVVMGGEMLTRQSQLEFIKNNLE